MPESSFTARQQPVCTITPLVIGAVALFAMSFPRSALAHNPRADAERRLTKLRSSLAMEKILAADTAAPVEATRQRYHIPRTDTSDVQLVGDDSVCALAGDAFNADLPTRLQVANRAVYVVRIGTVYIVSDPSAQPIKGGLQPNIVFDSRFRVLARFAA